MSENPPPTSLPEENPPADSSVRGNVPAADHAAEGEHLALWAQAWEQVLGQASGAAAGCTVAAEAPADLAAPAETDLWILAAASGGLRGELSLRLSPGGVLRLAQTFMGEPLTPEAQPTAEHGEAVVELLRQIAGLVSTGLKPRWGEVQLRLEAAAGPPSWPASSTYWLRWAAEPTPVIAEVQLSAALAAALRVQPSSAEAAASVAAGASSSAALPASPGAAAAAAASPASGAAAASLPVPDNVNLDLLMDVELAVTLRFGSRRLLLREVLDLSPGSVVELDRKVEEPVDMLLDGRLLARGEVVVLEGCYGLRITEVAPGAHL